MSVITIFTPWCQKNLWHSAYPYLTVVYYVLLPRAQTTTLQRLTNQGPTLPHRILPSIFFRVNLLLYTYKLFCYRIFGHKPTALEPASYKALKVPVKQTIYRYRYRYYANPRLNPTKNKHFYNHRGIGFHFNFHQMFVMNYQDSL